MPYPAMMGSQRSRGTITAASHNQSCEPVRVAGVIYSRNKYWLLASMPVIGSIPSLQLFGDFSSICSKKFSLLVTAVPLSLPDEGQWQGRRIDCLARKKIGKCYTITPPWYSLLDIDSYAKARAHYLNHANAKQNGKRIPLTRIGFALIPAIRQALHHSDKSTLKILEGHAELSFFAMNGQSPLKYPQHLPAGCAERCTLLRRQGILRLSGRSELMAHEITEREILAACALCWSARRVAQHRARRLAQQPPKRDNCGRPMAIYY